MATNVQETTVIIVGAGPSGLATAACLHQLSVPYIILEREDCIAPIFNKKSYNRLHLHLTKDHCQLPHLPFRRNNPTFVPLISFLKYLDNYASQFKISPIFGNFVKLAKYDEDRKIWKVEAKTTDGEDRDYEGKFLVVATGETSDAFIPQVDGLSEFKGKVIHSTDYKSGEAYANKTVLVVGAGNTGMEIALDLCTYGAKTSIVIRNPIHIISRWSLNFGLMLLKNIPLNLVDSFLVWLSKVMYGDLSKYGIERHKDGPFLIRVRDGTYPVIDMGTFEKIKSGEIQVLRTLKSIIGGGNEVVFEDGKCYQFDVIVFATGFKTSTHLWLQGGDSLLTEDGLAKPMFPNNWKGENGLYCAGLARRGLYGAVLDAQKIADHISSLFSK